MKSVNLWCESTDKECFKFLVNTFRVHFGSKHKTIWPQNKVIQQSREMHEQKMERSKVWLSKLNIYQQRFQNNFEHHNSTCQHFELTTFLRIDISTQKMRTSDCWRRIVSEPKKRNARILCIQNSNICKQDIRKVYFLSVSHSKRCSHYGINASTKVINLIDWQAKFQCSNLLSKLLELS